jgi:hypothetical protein
MNNLWHLRMGVFLVSFPGLVVLVNLVVETSLPSAPMAAPLVFLRFFLVFP